MRIVFTKSEAIGSKLIRFMLDEPVSHTAFIQDDKVLHATFAGVKKQTLPEFISHNDIVYELEISDDGKLFEMFDKKYNGDEYDYAAFAYFSWRAILRKIFRIPLPKSNPFDSSSAELCTEVVCELLHITEIEDSITSPYELFKFIANRLSLEQYPEEKI